MSQNDPTKTGFKTAKSPKGGAELPLGAHPGNTGGKKGRSGRKSNDFLARCLAATEDDELWRLSRKKSPHATLDTAASYIYGKPTQQVVTSGKIEIVIRREPK